MIIQLISLSILFWISKGSEVNRISDMSFLKDLGVPSCLNGSYFEYKTQKCEKCKQNCQTCFGIASNCTSCDFESQFLQLDEDFTLNSYFDMKNQGRVLQSSQAEIKSQEQDLKKVEVKVPPKPSYLLSQKIQSCHFCHEMQNFYFSQSMKQCQTCPILANCDQCLDETICLKCSKGFAFSLEEKECIKAEVCQQQKQILITILKTQICRNNNDYYVDSSSQKPYEFGTFDYPFKSPYFAAKEIFNTRSFVQEEINLFLEESSEFILDAMDEPMIFANLPQLNIRPYSKFLAKITKKPIMHMNTTSSQKIRRRISESFFNFQLIKNENIDYQILSKVETGEIMEKELKGFGFSIYVMQKIIIFDSSVSFFNIFFKADSVFGGAYIDGRRSITKKILIDNCYAEVVYRFLFTLEGYHFEVRRSEFLLVNDKTNSVVHSIAFGRNCDFGELNNKLDFYDNVVTQKNGFMASDGVIYLQGVNNATIYNNTFLNLGGKTQNAFLFYTASQLSCSRIGNHVVNFRNNTIIGNMEIVTPATTLFNIDIRGQPHFYGKHFVNILDNVIKNFRIQGEVVRVKDAGKGLDLLLLQGNVFENIQLTDTSSPFINAIGHVIVKDSYFKNLNSQTLALIKGSLQFQNVTIQDIPGALKQVQSFIQVSNGAIFQLENVKVEKVRVQALSFNQFETIGKVAINDLKITQSSFLSHIFNFQDTYHLRANSIEVTEVNQGRQNSAAGYLFYQRNLFLKDKSLDFELNSIQMKQSSLGLYDLSKVQQETPTVVVRHGVSFGKVEIKAVTHNSASSQAFISLPAFVNQNFSLKLSEFKVAFESSNQPFLISRSNSKLEIRNIVTLNLENSFLILNPAVQDKGTIPLELILDKFESKNSFLNYNNLIIGNLNTIAELSNLNIKNITSLSDGGVLFVDKNFDGMPYIVKDSVFEDCNSFQGGVSTSKAKARIIFQNSKFTNNFAINGGVIQVTDEGSSIFRNCTFENNEAFNGHIAEVINSNYENSFLDSQFKQNGKNKDKKFPKSFQALIQSFLKERPKTSGYVVSLRSEVTFKGGLYLENCEVFVIANAQSLIQLINLKIENSVFDTFVDMSQSSINSQNLLLKNIRRRNIQKATSFINSKVGSEIVLNQTIVEELQNDFLAIDQTQLLVSNLQFMKQGFIESFNSFIKISSSQATFENVKLSGLSGNSENLFLVQSSDINFDAINVNKIKIPFLHGILSDIKVSGSSFKEFSKSNQHPNTESVFELEDSFFTLIESSFSNFQGLRAISAQNQEGQKLKRNVSVLQSTFKELNGQEGASILVSNSDVLIKASDFSSNESPGQAGALLLKCAHRFKPQCQFDISNSRFQNNKAKSGGAIAFDLFPPKITEVIFSNNQASLEYGNDIAAYPVELRLEESPISFNSGYNSKEKFKFSLRDHFGQIVKIESNEPLTAVQTLLETSILGMKNSYQKEGLYTFDDLYFLGNPGSQGQIKFESKMINPIVFEKVMKKPFKNLEFSFQFRACESGEVLSSNICKPCSRGLFSLDLKEKTCNFCPQHFACKGLDSLSLEKGYWRTNVKSTQAMQCLNPLACPGGEEITCAEGYKGILCANCVGLTEKGYFAPATSFSCQICESNSIIWLKIFGIILMIIIYVAVLVFMIIQSATRNQYSSVLLRIFTNYLQITLMVRNLRIYWPTRIERLLDALSITQSIQQDMFQFSCIFKNQNQSSYTLSMAILALMPFVLSAFGLLFWKFMSIVKPSRFGRTYKRNSILTAFTIAYLSFPMIINYTFSAFRCKEIDGKNFFIEDFSIECYGKQHNLILVFVVAPSIIVWAIGFPLFTYYRLRKHLKTLNERETIIKYGIFYIGLKDQKFFWEIIIGNGRKVILILLVNSITENKSFQQLLLIFTFLFINHQLIKYQQPYEEVWLNQIDLHASLAAISCVLLGLIYVKNTEATSSVLLEMVFYILLMLNATFIIRWIFNLISIYAKEVKKSVEERNFKVNEKKRRMEEGFHYNRFSIIERLENKSKEQTMITDRRFQAISQISMRQNKMVLQVDPIQEMKIESQIQVIKSSVNQTKFKIPISANSKSKTPLSFNQRRRSYDQ